MQRDVIAKLLCGNNIKLRTGPTYIQDLISVMEMVIITSYFRLFTL